MMSITTLSGRPASALCFGAMQFGGTAEKRASEEMYADCRAAGVNFFDTAYAYTGGLSETWLGAMAKSKREDLIIATKAGYTGGAGRANLYAQFDESRKRLCMETVDLSLIHI